MRSFEFLESWKDNPDNIELASKVRIIDNKSFCFEDAVISSLDYASSSGIYTVLFECGEVKGKLSIRNLKGRAFSYPFSGRIDQIGSYIEIRDCDNMLSFIFSNNESGLFMIIYAVEATLSSVK